MVIDETKSTELHKKVDDDYCNSKLARLAAMCSIQRTKKGRQQDAGNKTGGECVVSADAAITAAGQWQEEKGWSSVNSLSELNDRLMMKPSSPYRFCWELMTTMALIWNCSHRDTPDAATEKPAACPRTSAVSPSAAR